MNKKLYFLILFIFFLIPFTTALPTSITENTSITPALSGITYIANQDFTSEYLNIGDYCVNITGGTYDGEYCYNINSVQVEEAVLFENFTYVDCYANIDNVAGETINLNYEWYNSSNSIIKSGSSTCEHGENCTVDTLTGSYLNNGENVSCRIIFNESWYQRLEYNSSNSRQVYAIGKCNGIYPYNLFNISYFDELTGIDINATNNYDITLYDGESTTLLTGDDTNHSLNYCTNYVGSTLNFNLYGNLVLSSTGYVTRSYNIPFVAAYDISNNPYTNISLSLISVSNSSTLTFNWQTTDFVNIDGIMLIYKCEPDGTESLIESTTISSGIAIANLELLTTAYKYEVIIDGQTYTDNLTFSACHAEYVTERTFYVDVTQIDIMPVIGLFLVDCVVENTSSNTVKMSWGSNPEDSDDIEACIVVQRDTIYSKVEIYRSCSNASSGSISRTIPATANNYYVTGEIYQNGYKGYCQDTVIFNQRGDLSTSLGIDGLLFMFILVASLVLLFIGENEYMILGAIIGVLIAYFIGITSIHPAIVTSIVIFLIIVTLVAKTYKKRI